VNFILRELDCGPEMKITAEFGMFISTRTIVGKTKAFIKNACRQYSSMLVVVFKIWGEAGMMRGIFADQRGPAWFFRFPL